MVRLGVGSLGLKRTKAPGDMKQPGHASRLSPPFPGADPAPGGSISDFGKSFFCHDGAIHLPLEMVCRSGIAVRTVIGCFGL